MLRLLVLALFLSVALCDLPTPNNVNALADVAGRLSFNITQAVADAQQNEFLTLQANLTVDLAGLLNAVQATSADLVTQLQGQIASAQAVLQSALTTFVSQAATLIGKVSGLAELVKDVGDAAAAAQVECEDLEQLFDEAVAAVPQITNEKLQASLNETQKLLALAVQLPVLRTAQLTGIGLPDAQAATLSLLSDLALARAQGKVLDSLAPRIQNFIGNATAAINRCRDGVQQRIAALALKVTAAWDDIRATVAADIEDWKVRYTNVLTRIMGETLLYRQILETAIDDINHAVQLKVALNVAPLPNEQFNATQQRVIRILQAVCVALTGGNADVVILPSSKRQTGSMTAQITIRGDSQIDLSSLGITTTKLSDAVSQFQAQVQANSDAIKAQFAAFQQELANLTQAQIDAATATFQRAFAAASQAWSTAQQAWNAKLTALNTMITSAKQTILSAVATVRDKAIQLLQLRKSQLEAKLSELQATVQKLEANLQSLALDEQTIKSAILAVQANLTAAISAGNANLQASLQAQISLLQDTFTQKLQSAAVAQSWLNSLQGNLTLFVARIQAEEADISARVADFKVGLANTIENIKAHLAGNQTQIQARLQELAQILDANIQTVQASFAQLASSVQVTINVNFAASVSTDEIQAFITTFLKAEFGTDNVKVVLSASNKRNALTTSATYDAQVGASDGSASGAVEGTPAASTSFPVGAIIGIVVAIVVIVIVVVVVVVFVVPKKRQQDDAPYRVM